MGTTGTTATGRCSVQPQQLRQLGDIRRDPPRGAFEMIYSHAEIWGGYHAVIPDHSDLNCLLERYRRVRGASAITHTSNPETMQAANELFSLLSKDMIDQIASNLTAQTWPMMEQKLIANRPEIDIATRAELRSAFDHITAQFFIENMQDAPTLYARYFTAQELRDMIAFYRTSTGQKSLRVMPQVMSDFTTSMVPRLIKFSQTVDAQAEEAFAKILRERGYIK